MVADMNSALWRCASITLLSLTLWACDAADKESGTGQVNTRKTTTRSTDINPADKINLNKQREAYFGDLHLHTIYSSDAFIMGAFVSPDMAYRYAKGEMIQHPLGDTAKLHIPLDFLAVTDHSEWFGEIGIANNPNHPLYEESFPADLRQAWQDEKVFGEIFSVIFNTEKEGKRPEFSLTNKTDIDETIRTVWDDTIAAAERHNEPGRFTTFIAFEWTASPKGVNNHRNVIFRGAEVPEYPISFFEVREPEGLWDWIENTAGGADDVLAIPHGSNLSNGLMFQPVTSAGKPYDAAVAARRKAFEPLVEIAQIKGYSESNPRYAPNDEFIDFQLLAKDFSWADDGPQDSPYSWVREGLKEGLVQADQSGVNPFEYGFVGATDAHFGLAGDVSEENWRAIYSKTEIKTGYAPRAGTMNPGALTGVWAESNTREHIWQALKRREAFATSGTRMRVRLFAGWGYPDNLQEQENWLDQAYQSGVPMGAVLPGAYDSSAPKFAIWALKAVDGAPLDRVQIIKGWLEDGKAREIIYDVVCADGRTPSPHTRRCAASEATVDLTDCSYADDMGDVELQTVWRDPDFNPAAHAFYYVRVLENPTCRWTRFETLRNGTEYPGEISQTIQERAWSSPVWYVPGARLDQITNVLKGN